ncbi:MAG: cation:proton antiporter [Chloroflexota bacterium]|nr:MAG: cation:proton antiporter [Chloroflexota bacterium]
MAGFDPIVNVAIVLAAALVGGMVAHRLRQPVILGYLLIGVAVGPYGFGLVGDVELFETLATIGVALLMFTVGLEISYSQLRETGKVGIWGGIAQILATFVLGLIAGKFLLRWPLGEAAFFGLLISLSSTMVGLKMLMERGELDSMHGRIMIAILIVQDLSVVLMMVGVPVFGASLERLLPTFAVAMSKTVLFLGIAIGLGLWVLPWLLGRVAGLRSRELFLLTVLILCFGAAFGTYIFGLSIAFGAFVVGLLLRESVFAHQAMAEITHLRDVFATLFFVSLGMLLSPKFVVENWSMVTLAIVVIIAVKFGVCFGIARLFGYGGRTALFIGAGLAQIGEFSFILAQAGMDSGIIPGYSYSLIISSTVVTMLLTPLMVTLVSLVYPRLAKAPTRGKLVVGDTSLLSEYESRHPSPEIVLCGYGRVGHNVAKNLYDLGIPYLVIEIDPELVAEMHSKDEKCIYGDASNAHVLSLAGLDRARVLIVTYPDPLSVVTTVKNALRINARLKIVARVHSKRESEVLEKLGVSELVSPEYEASFEFLRHTLAYIGWSRSRIQKRISRIRNDEEITELSDGDEE